MEKHGLLINLAALMQKSTGISVYTQNLLPQISQLSPTVLSAKPFPNFKRLEIPDNLTPEFGFQGHLRRLAWLQKNLSEYYYSSNSSLIFSPLPEAPLYRNCRFIVTVHDTIPLRFPKKFSLLTNYFRYYVPRVLDEAQHILCNSTSTAKDLSRFYAVPADKITTTLLAYDRQNFRPCDVSTGNYFLYLGRQNFYKNLNRLISAFYRVSKPTDTELWFVGPTDQRYTPHLISQAQELGVAHRLRWLDYVEYAELPRLLSGAIALVFPSLWEGFGLPALEGMACGTPVITSKLSSLPEVVGDAAILIDPYKVDELADAMLRVIRDRQLRHQLSIAGLKRAQLFNWEKTGQQTADVIRRFL